MRRTIGAHAKVAAGKSLVTGRIVWVRDGVNARKESGLSP